MREGNDQINDIMKWRGGTIPSRRSGERSEPFLPQLKPKMAAVTMSGRYWSPPPSEGGRDGKLYRPATPFALRSRSGSRRFDELFGGIIQDPALTALCAMDIQQVVVDIFGVYGR